MYRERLDLSEAARQIPERTNEAESVPLVCIATSSPNSPFGVVSRLLSQPEQPFGVCDRLILCHGTGPSLAVACLQSS